jgi:hypothetical protein
LIKYWFGYGLLLCALGMQKETEERSAAKAAESRNGDDENTEVDDLSRIGTCCDGIARVVIPLIRTLYRGPDLAGG